MGLPRQIAAYEDCIDLYMRATQSRTGARALLGPHGKAKKYQMRMYMIRELLRQEAELLYPDKDPRWGKCEYDSFQVTLQMDTADNWWVYVKPWAMAVFTIEDIPDETVDPEAEPGADAEDEPETKEQPDA